MAPNFTKLLNAGETLHVEFKGERQRALNDRDLIEAVACMANRASAAAAWILIGVEDSGDVTGARPRHGKLTEPAKLEALIANRTNPALACDVELHEVNGKPVIAIRVPRSEHPIGTTDGTFTRRVRDGVGKPECRPMAFQEMQSQGATFGSFDLSSTLVRGARWEDLDPMEFHRYRQAVTASGQGDKGLAALSDVELAKALGAVEANHRVNGIRLLGLLLFGTTDALRRLVPTHEVAFQVLSGTGVAVNQVSRAPLLRLLEEILAQFRARNREEEIIVGPYRIGIPDYPERAIREAMANALVHREYSRNAAVHLQWHDDRIEISSPGGFPEGVQVSNLLVAPPRPRNPALAVALMRAGFVERTGRGIDTIFSEQLRNGRPAPSYDRTTRSDVVVVLPGGAANLDFVRLLIEERDAGREVTLDGLLLLNQLWRERFIDTARAAQVIQKGHGEAREVIGRLAEIGLVEMRGEGKSRAYCLSAATYRRRGGQSAYVRLHGFDAVQVKNMVIQYVVEYGRITRRQAEELCRMNVLQSKRLLARMVADGTLEMHGQRRWAYYTLANPDQGLHPETQH
jgi:ATP-dependent DNA helicase RecG